MKQGFLKLPAAAFAILALIGAPAVLSLGDQAAHAQSQQFSDQQLEGFVVAQDEIRAISGELQQQMNEADNPEQVEQLREEANQKMVHAVRRAGLDVETYNEIASAMRNDQQLAEQIQDIQNDMNGGQ